MKIEWIKKILIPFVFITLMISTTLTYISIKSKQDVELPKEVYLDVIPEYQITSRKNLTIWPEGTVFDQGMAAYFYAAEPQISVTPVVKISGMDQGSVNGTIQSQIVVQSVNDKSEVY